MTTLGFNAPLAAGTQATGVRVDPYLAFNFLAEFKGLVVGGFSEISGLEVETDVTEYQEGGLNEYVHRLPGPTRYPSNVVLSHGLTDIESMWSWHQDVVSGKIKRRNGTIYLLDPQRIPVMWWDIKEAYPVKWTGPRFDGQSAAVAVESLELVHRGISKPLLSRAASAGRLAVDVGTQLF
jgi:phage tail-like protein